ncbi:DUF1360 domain-containing protein [Hoyosella altamirensis]|uniref:DUF1360 domain-containing protein n=1 Tax=Hoyosella altamirensis TaxID=616997 RepID=A0A839RTC9_9ACTN|nr:DUF1360 domain-containing protein [Hoyosella altamirensis]MBB3040162.1 hypothetical protein [Hoyosella altamirensis]
MGLTLFLLAIYTLAVLRVTRLITRDKITQPLRRWVADRFDDPDRPESSMTTYLFHCPACMSIWIAFALAPAAIALSGLTWWLLPFLALAASQLTVWNAVHLDPVDD